MVERLQTSIDAGETWMVYDGDQTIATLALDRYADPQLWTPEERDQPAFYLHRLIVDRDHAGHGHGANLIDWACDHAAAEAALWVRIDAWTTNIALQRYYLAHGFQHVRAKGHRLPIRCTVPAPRAPTPHARHHRTDDTHSEPGTSITPSTDPARPAIPEPSAAELTYRQSRRRCAALASRPPCGRPPPSAVLVDGAVPLHGVEIRISLALTFVTSTTFLGL